MRRRRSSSSAFSRVSCEVLQARVLPAGAVSVSLDGGVLTVEGAKKSDKVTVGFDAETSEVVISGEKTTINGGTEALRAAPLDVQHIVANLGNGKNVFILRDLTISGSVQVTGGTKADRFGILNSQVRGALSLNTGPGKGKDGIAITQSVIDGAATLNLGEGNDKLGFDSANMQIINLVLGGGNDRVVGASTQFHQRMTVQTGAGNDGLVFGGGHGFRLRVDPPPEVLPPETPSEASVAGASLADSGQDALFLSESDLFESVEFATAVTPGDPDFNAKLVQKWIGEVSRTLGNLLTSSFPGLFETEFGG